MPEEEKPTSTGSLFNFSLTDLFGAGKGVEKLVAALQAASGRLASGIGEVISVKWLDRSKADNEAYRAQVVGTAQTQVIQERARAIAALAREGLHPQSVNITDTGVNAQLAGLPPEVRAMHERSQQRLAYDNIMQQLNRETVIAHAAAELADAQQVADEPVSPDWMTRLLRTVQDISNEEMQLIFGKILAGETKKPGSFSPRTIDFLATLTQDEAEVFTRLCTFSWDEDGTKSIIVFSLKNGEHDMGLPDQHDLSQLEDIGLIETLFTMFSGSYYWHNESLTLSYGDTLVEVKAKQQREDEHEKEPSILAGRIKLTKIGQELARVCQPVLNPCIVDYVLDGWNKDGYSATRFIQVAKPADI